MLQAMKGAGFKPTVKRGVKRRQAEGLSPASGTPVRTAEIGVIRPSGSQPAETRPAARWQRNGAQSLWERQTVRINKGWVARWPGSMVRWLIRCWSPQALAQAGDD